MRTKLPFSDVSKIVELNSADTSTPDNIVFAPQGNEQEQKQFSVDILKATPSVNAVVMLNPQRSNTEKVINALQSVSLGNRINFKHQPKQNLHDALTSYLERRSRQHKSPLMDLDLGKISNIICDLHHQSVLLSYNLKGVSFISNRLTYAPNYTGSQTSEAGYINTHIDGKTGADIRMIECINGSGTVLFDDNDFEISSENKLRVVNKNITGWCLATGSSVAIRVPSENNENMNARPTPHAHGIGQPGDIPEQRLTSKQDFAFD